MPSTILQEKTSPDRSYSQALVPFQDVSQLYSPIGAVTFYCDDMHSKIALSYTTSNCFNQALTITHSSTGATDLQ